MNPDAIRAEIDSLKAALYAASRFDPPQPVADALLSRDDGSPVRLSALFGEKPDLILIHNMGRACPYCTLWADGFIGLWPHLASRAGFALCSPDEPMVLRDFARSRKWPFPCVSAAGTTFIHDMGFEPAPGKPMPGVSTFRRRRDGIIERIASTLFGPMDDFCAVWPMFQMLADGPNGWSPKYSY